jgi:CHAT domain-containing protein
MQNLAGAYADLPTGARGAQLAQAIACYEAALRVRTEQDWPVEWARTMQNLARAYADLPTGDRGAQLAQAIACCEAALRVFTAQDFPCDWAWTMQSLAGAYARLPTGDRGANLARAMTHYKAALRVFTAQDFPEEWARTMNALAVAYHQLPTRDRGANLAQEIASYEAALQVFTEQDWPDEWAQIMHNLAGAYHQLPTGERGANLARAITCYEAALRVRTAKQLPFECLETLYSLSQLYYQEHQWQELSATCEASMRVLEHVRTAAMTAAERTRLLTTYRALFDWAVISGVESARFAEALVATDRGKTRNLIDALVRRDPPPRQLPEAAWRAYLDHLAAAQRMEQQLAAASMYVPGTAEHSQQLYQALGRIRAEIERLEAQFRATDPDYLPTALPLGFADVQAVVRQAQAVLVAFRVTAAGTFVFLLSGDETDVTAEQVVRVPAFTSAMLQDLLVKVEDGQAVDGWLVQYYQRQEGETGRQAWLDCLEQVMGVLQEHLLHHVQARLRRLYPQATRLLVVPNQGLNLLPLHAADAGSNGQRRYWLDDYDILYAPSCAVIQRCLRREAQRTGREALFAVQNPSGDLPFADWEVEEVVQYCCRTHILPGAQATLAQVKQWIAQGHEILLSCHGNYTPNDVFASHLVLHGDDRLWLSDILQLDLSHAWLVVLSACETAFSDYPDVVDEVQGLHTAFLIAGAPTVVGSLWAVDSLATALLMQRFHANLYSSGLPKVSALREAQQWLRGLSLTEARALLNTKRDALQRTPADEKLTRLDLARARFTLDDLAGMYGDTPFAHPYWWAAFQCLGAS